MLAPLILFVIQPQVDPAQLHYASMVAGDAGPADRIVGGIISYTRWPTGRGGASVRLCLTGNPRLGSVPQPVVPGVAQPLQPVMRRSSDIDSSVCDAVYIGNVQPGERAALIARLRGTPVLTLTDIDPLCNSGAMFCLTGNAASPRYHVNLDAVARSTLRIDARVLRMAQRSDAP